MKNRLLFIFIFCAQFLIPSLVFAIIQDPVSFSIQATGQALINLSDTQKAVLFYNKGSLEIQINGTKQTLTALEDALNDQVKIEIHDYNFDGHNDLAVPVSYGYMGVNTFYDIYFYQPKDVKFDKYLTEVCNPETNSDSQELKTNSKSGFFWQRQIYRISEGKPYLYKESECLTGSGLCKESFKDLSGNNIKTHVVLDGEENNDLENVSQLTAKVKQKATLFENSDENTPTKMYLIKDDVVTLLNLAGPGWEWVQIEYQGKSNVQKWMRYEDLDIGMNEN